MPSASGAVLRRHIPLTDPNSAAAKNMQRVKVLNNITRLKLGKVIDVFNKLQSMSIMNIDHDRLDCKDFMKAIQVCSSDSLPEAKIWLDDKRPQTEKPRSYTAPKSRQPATRTGSPKRRAVQTAVGHNTPPPTRAARYKSAVEGVPSASLPPIEKPRPKTTISRLNPLGYDEKGDICLRHLKPVTTEMLANVLLQKQINGGFNGRGQSTAWADRGKAESKESMAVLADNAEAASASEQHDLVRRADSIINTLGDEHNAVVTKEKPTREQEGGFPSNTAEDRHDDMIAVSPLGREDSPPPQQSESRLDNSNDVIRESKDRRGGLERAKTYVDEATDENKPIRIIDILRSRTDLGPRVQRRDSSQNRYVSISAQREQTTRLMRDILRQKSRRYKQGREKTPLKERISSFYQTVDEIIDKQEKEKLKETSYEMKKKYILLTKGVKAALAFSDKHDNVKAAKQLR